MQVDVEYAKAHLSELINAAERGEEVIITANGRPPVKMIPINLPVSKPRKG